MEESLEQKLDKEQLSINIHRKLLEKFPDIKIHKDRWGTERLYSPSINLIANEVLIKHGCSCCPDSYLQTWPYIVVDGLPVFSDPPFFDVAKGSLCGYGEIPFENWEEPIKKANISEKIIAEIQKFLNENPPKDFSEKDTDYCEYNG